MITKLYLQRVHQLGMAFAYYHGISFLVEALNKTRASQERGYARKRWQIVASHTKVYYYKPETRKAALL